jgi:quercetin dioxygenase-like cupin family protein
VPYFYRTGVGPDGRSGVVERCELTMTMDALAAHRIDEAVIEMPGSDSSAALLESMTAPGGSFCNIFAWRPGAYTDLHRTITVDFDVVLTGFIEMELEAETIMLRQGDCVLLPGTVHAWRPGPQGALVVFTMVAGRPAGRDIGAPRGSHDSIMHAPAAETD